MSVPSAARTATRGDPAQNAPIRVTGTWHRAAARASAASAGGGTASSNS